MPRYELNKTADGAEQWIELKDRADITRKELRATRLAWDAEGGITAKVEAHTEAVLAHCLTNWQVYARSGDVIPLPQKNPAEIQAKTAALDIDTWYAIENAINGTPPEGDGERGKGYSKEFLDFAPQADPQAPSTG